MRVLASLLWLGLIVASAHGQWAVLNGPTLGFTPENGGSRIRPILGIPGASSLGEPIQLGVEIRGAVISPNHDFAIAARVEDGRMVVIDLGSGVRVSEVAGVKPGADVMAVSPSGAVAAVVDQESKTVQVVGSLPNAPEVVREFDGSWMTGRIVSLAVSDSGETALVRVVEQERVSLWAMIAGGGVLPVAADRPAAAVFFPGKHDALVADDGPQGAFIVMDVAGAGTRVPLGSEGIKSLGVSGDGRTVFVADGKNVAMMDLESRWAVAVPCECETTGFYRLKGSSVFRLMEASSAPMMVLDAGGEEPRIVIVPPSVPTGEAR